MSRAACIIGCLLAAGCGRSNVPQPRPIVVVGNPVAVVRSVLEGYASGQPVGSERDFFDTWAEEIGARDAEAAAILGPALREIAASPSRAAGIATRSLSSLSRKPAGDSASP